MAHAHAGLRPLGPVVTPVRQPSGAQPRPVVGVAAPGVPVALPVGVQQYQRQQPAVVQQYVASGSSPRRQGGAPVNVSPAEFQARLEGLFTDPAALEARIRIWFGVMARPAPSHTTPVLRLEDMPKVVELLSSKLQVDPKVFGEIGQMFWRFDFSGDGLLDEDEAVKLVLCMLRQYRDATRPPQPGIVKLGGHIDYRDVGEKYDVTKKLGEGGQGAVYLASDLSSGQQVVVKYYDKSSPNAPVEDITQEFELMMKLKHPRIAHYFDIFQDAANIYVVQEPYFGGDLTTAVWKATEAGVRVDERWQAGVMQQVLAGIAFLHSNDIMHCDLKEANVMITGETDWHQPQVVVIDFGLANAFTSMSQPGGTPGYMPPEVWEFGLWTPRGDVFSIGVMLFSMRTGTSPFVDGASTIEDVRDFTMTRAPSMQLGTDSLKTLVMSMLSKSFQQRPSIAMVLEDSWFRGAAGSQAIDEKVLSRMAQQRKSTQLQKALLADLASRQNLAELRELNDLFVHLDKDNDGHLSAEEVRQGLAGQWQASEIENLITALISDSSGGLSYEEFMGQLIAAKEPEENALLSKLFMEFDKEKKGYLSTADLAQLLKRPAVARVLGNREPEALMREMDEDGDGKVEFFEFRAAMQQRSAWDGGAPAALPMGGSLQKGQKLQYYSTTYNSWIPCVVTAVDARAGAVQVDCKPNYWIRGNEMKRRLRCPTGGSSCSPVAAAARQLWGGIHKVFSS
eukprot:TRINITY_DN62730_c0_g1_i1.p1 TRINITY_DN62730_c0_g1~~TRINITY_DN62730_c0_g1_i1.p1  ORF type:complete len:764 (+),score=182.02 TRINITY_DN62730_c0_g1_i1:90-2294(+)